MNDKLQSTIKPNCLPTISHFSLSQFVIINLVIFRDIYQCRCRTGLSTWTWTWTSRWTNTSTISISITRSIWGAWGSSVDLRQNTDLCVRNIVFKKKIKNCNIKSTQYNTSQVKMSSHHIHNNLGIIVSYQYTVLKLKL